MPLCSTNICWYIHFWCLSFYLLSFSQFLFFSPTFLLMSIKIGCPLILFFDTFEGYSTFINFLQITLFIPHLNYSLNSLLLYLFLLAALLNFCTNFSIVLLLCSNFFNSTTFIVLLFLLLNSFFELTRNSSTITNFSSLLFKFSIIFSF